MIRKAIQPNQIGSGRSLGDRIFFFFVQDRLLRTGPDLEFLPFYLVPERKRRIRNHRISFFLHLGWVRDFFFFLVKDCPELVSSVPLGWHCFPCHLLHLFSSICCARAQVDRTPGLGLFRQRHLGGPSDIHEEMNWKLILHFSLMAHCMAVEWTHDGTASASAVGEEYSNCPKIFTFELFAALHFSLYYSMIILLGSVVFLFFFC